MTTPVLPRYFTRNDIAPSQCDSHEELVASLTRLVTNFPPTSLPPGGGLYYGPTSIAFLFFALQKVYDFKIADTPLETWYAAYIKVSTDGLQTCTGPRPDECGIIEDVSANLALRAASTKDPAMAKELCSFAKVATLQGASNEWLYGRAGYLYLLRLVSASFSDDQETLDLIRRTADVVIWAILDEPRPWIWYNRNYVGPGHGTMGIITQVVLTEPSYALQLKPDLETLLSHQFESGNWPSVLPPDADERVQFCHGASGMVLSLLSIAPYFPDMKDAIDTAIVKGRADTKRRGLLTKEPGLCHGISGNALALRDRDCEHFLAFTTVEAIERMKQANLLKMGTHPESLMAGEAGRAWAWAVMDKGLEKRLLGYNDI